MDSRLSALATVGIGLAIGIAYGVTSGLETVKALALAAVIGAIGYICTKAWGGTATTNDADRIGYVFMIAAFALAVTATLGWVFS